MKIYLYKCQRTNAKFSKSNAKLHPILFYAMPNVWHQVGDFVCMYDIHLICTCRLPESSDYNVIQCDQCQQWYMYTISAA